MEIKWGVIRRPQIKELPSNLRGVYKFYIHSDLCKDEILYIGRSSDIKKRLLQHSYLIENIIKELPVFKEFLIGYHLSDEYVKLEYDLINFFNPLHNGNSKNKSISDVSDQIKSALDGRKFRWLSLEVKIPENRTFTKNEGQEVV